jgi:hypothetical protein
MPRPKIKMGAFFAKTRARAMRCCCPPLIEVPRSDHGIETLGGNWLAKSKTLAHVRHGGYPVVTLSHPP